MQVQNETATSFREKLKSYLNDEGRTQRWLMRKMEEKGLSLKQSQLSNRLTGFIEFREFEKSIINEVLNTDF